MIQTQRYRPDIDGLRAIAVLAVVFFHAFPKAFPGGFIGVDVFFVISGYLISNIIFKKLESEQFSFCEFYDRRVRRIFPALLLVLGFVILVGALILLPKDFAELGKHVVSGVFFFSNFTLWKEVGYFDTSHILKPLLHLWSLSIEEQFYLFFPVILLTTWRKNFSSVFVLVAITLVSFGLNIFLVKGHLNSVFYFPVTRGWELLFGSLLGRFEIKQSNQNGPANVSSAFGLILILGGVFLLSERNIFPGFWALIPTLGAVLILNSDTNSFVNCRILSHPLLREVGLISYPLYLWHWPLLSFIVILEGGVDSAHHKQWVVCSLIVSFLFAELTYRLIEKKFKTAKYQDTSWTRASSILVSVMVGIGIVGLFVFESNGFPDRFAKSQNAIDSIQLYDLPSDKLKRTCLPEFKVVDMCMIEIPSRPITDVLIGDSHAEHIYVGLSKYLLKPNRNLALFAQSGTPPLLNVGAVKREKQSDDMFLQFVLSHPEIKHVYLSAFWSDYSELPLPKFDGGTYNEPLIDLEPSSRAKGNQLVEISLRRTLKMLTEAGKQVVLFQDVPSLPFQLKSCLPKPIDAFISSKDPCKIEAKSYFAESEAIRSVVQKVGREFKAVKIFDPTLIFCNQSECKIKEDGLYLYADEHHLSAHGSEWLARHFNF